MIDEVLTKGFYRVKDPECFQFIDEHSVQWPLLQDIPCQLALVSPELQEAYNKTQQYLADKYVSKLWKKIVPNYVDLVNGLDDNVYEWHSDYELNKVNLGILLYFSDTDEDIGSAIEFRKKDTKEITGGFYPKRYDICIINQGLEFQHRVSLQKMKMPRIVGSFHYWVEK